jgi:hypothetical protein
MTWLIVIIGIFVLFGLINNFTKGKKKQTNQGLSGVFMTGPSKRPELPAELKPFVTQLVSVYKQHHTFDYKARDSSREIRERINTSYGYNGMVTVCDTVCFVINGTAARELELVWNYIGEWRN